MENVSQLQRENAYLNLYKCHPNVLVRHECRNRHVCLEATGSWFKEGENNNSDISVQIKFIPNWKFWFQREHFDPSEPCSVNSNEKKKKKNPKPLEVQSFSSSENKIKQNKIKILHQNIQHQKQHWSVNIRTFLIQKKRMGYYISV